MPSSPFCAPERPRNRFDRADVGAPCQSCIAALAPRRPRRARCLHRRRRQRVARHHLGALVGRPAGRPQRAAGLRRHRSRDRRHGRAAPIRARRWLRSSLVPRHPGPDLHALRRRHDRLPQPATETPQPIGSVFRQNPLRTAKLSEDQIQEVLAYALGDGGLGTARANYENIVSDASTAVFTVDAGGLKKAVSVYALGMDGPRRAGPAARAAFQRLADRLGDFDKGGTIATDVYQPKGYRGILEDGQAAPDQKCVAVGRPQADGLRVPRRSERLPDGHPRPDPRTGRAPRARGRRGRLPGAVDRVARSVARSIRCRCDRCCPTRPNEHRGPRSSWV